MNKLNWFLLILGLLAVFFAVMSALHKPLPIWLTTLPHGFTEPTIIERTVR